MQERKRGPYGIVEEGSARVRGARARPSNTTARDLLGNERLITAGLEFLRATNVGLAKKGVLVNGRRKQA